MRHVLIAAAFMLNACERPVTYAETPPDDAVAGHVTGSAHLRISPLTYQYGSGGVSLYLNVEAVGADVSYGEIRCRFNKGNVMVANDWTNFADLKSGDVTRVRIWDTQAQGRPDSFDCRVTEQ